MSPLRRQLIFSLGVALRRCLTALTCCLPIALFICSQAFAVPDDHVIYDDILQNSWRDGASAATRDFSSTDTSHSGTTSIKVTFTAGFQILNLRHRPGSIA